MKAHFKEVDPHKIQLYKKKVKSNKKKNDSSTNSPEKKRKNSVQFN